jgi:methylglyoxal synthase
MTELTAAETGRLAHAPARFAVSERPDHVPDRVPALVLTAEGPRRADLLAWAGVHRDRLAGLRLFAPPGMAAVLGDRLGVRVEVVRTGTLGPTSTAGLAAAGVLDGVVAFSDPLELRAGDTTTRALMRLAVFWDIAIAGNRATADMLLNHLAAGRRPGPVAARTPAAGAVVDGESSDTGGGTSTRGAIRLWHIRATVDDVPGRLAILAASLARRSINILSVQVHLTPDGPVDELLVAASPVLSAADLSAAVTEGGARLPRVSPADAHALVDPPTRALSLASRVVRTPDDLPAVLTELLGGATVRWRPEVPTTELGRPTSLWLDEPTGGGYLLTRDAVPFTPAESARAHVLIDVARAAAAAPPAGAPDAWSLLLPEGVELAVRRAAPDDLEAVVDLHARCSLTSRLRRYLAGTNCPSRAILAGLLDPEKGYSLIAEDHDGRVIALGNLMWADGTAELALLVEDSWQRRRVGTALARRLVVAAGGARVATVRSTVHAGNGAMIRIMAGLGRRLHREYDGGMLTLIAHLERPHATVR